MGKLIAALVAVGTVGTVGVLYIANRSPTPDEVCRHLGTVFADYDRGQCMDRFETWQDQADGDPQYRVTYDRMVRCIMRSRVQSTAWACLGH